MAVQGAGGPGHGARMFQRLDVNGDGQLDRSEMEKFAQRMSERTGQQVSVDDVMGRLDADGDGQVSDAEMRAGRPKGPPPGGAFGPEGSPFAGGLNKEQLEAMASRISTQTGQQVTADDLLKTLDANGDGTVAPEEMRDRFRSLREEAQSRMQSVYMRGR